MFQTEIIIFLQSFRNDFLTLFMRVITSLGYEPFYVAICIITLFGINFRKGFILIQIIIWSGIVNSILKHFFGMPRPLHVDTNVIRFYGNYPQFEFVSKGARGFFQLFDKNVIDHIRNYAKNHDFSYGFPSGHVMGTTGLWVSLSILFRKKIIIIFTPIIILLMAISRMYLGRHFLGDVMGGAIFGIIVVFTFYLMYFKFNFIEILFNRENYLIKSKIKSLILFLYLIIIPVILLFFFKEEVTNLFAVNISFYLIMLKGLPDNQGTIFKRALRVFIAFLSYLLIKFFLSGLININNINDDLLIIEFIEDFIPVFSATFLAYYICLRTNLYKLKVPLT